jgi:predicted DNA-binding transcriptional regulator YafY
MNRVERLLILVPWLRAHQGATVEDTAQHFEISSNQLVQDILLLSVTGFGQFYGEQFSVTLEDDRIYVDDTLGLDRPVKFDIAEAASLLLGLDAVATLPNIDSQAINSARSKLSSVLPLQSRLAIVKSENSDVDEVLKAAIKQSRQVRFEYWNSGRDDRTTRVASVLKVYFVDGFLFLDAFCHTSNAWRTFNVSRILNPVLLDSKSALPDGGFLEMSLTNIQVSVKAEHSAELENFSVVSRSQHGDRIDAEIAVFGQDLLIRRLIAAGGKIRVSQEIADKVSERARQGLSAYSAD